MPGKNPIAIAPLIIEKMGAKILVTDRQTNRSFATTSDHEIVISLSDGTRSLSEVLLEIHQKGLPLHLEKLSFFFEQLKKNGMLLSGGPEDFFEGDAKMTPSNYCLIPAKGRVQNQKPPVLFLVLFLAFSLLVGLGVIFGAHKLWNGLSPFHFLVFFKKPLLLTFSLWLINWIISAIRAFELVAFSYLSLGRRPNLLLHRISHLFFADVNPEEFRSLSRIYQSLVWILASTTPILCYFLASLFFQGAFLSLLAWICILRFLFFMSPFHSSDFSNLLNQFVSPNELRHFIPFLKSKSLLAFVQNKDRLPGEFRLILFGSYSIAWLFVLLYFCIDILTANLSSALAFFSQASLFQKIVSIEFVVLIFSLTYYVIKELSSILAQNFLSPFRSWKMRRKKIFSKTENLPSKEKVAVQLQNIPFFEPFSREEIERLVSKSNLVCVDKGAMLIVEGDVGKEMYVLIEGSVKVFHRLRTGLNETLANLSRNSIFGELAVISETKRTADVEVTQKSIILQIERLVLLDFLDIVNLPAERSAALKNRIALSRAITQSQYFKGLPHELAKLFFLPENKFLSPLPGTKIITQGQLGHEFYLVVQGSVDILRDRKTIETLQIGQFFGEISLMTSRTRTADVVAGPNCVVLEISASTFFKMLTTHWGLALNIALVSIIREDALA